MFVPGDIVTDRYEIVRRLDAGAMGEVFEAVHRTLQRPVALKVLRADAGVGRETMERFCREAQAAAAIGHPNIVDVIDLGVHEGRPFLVMELLRGQSLLERMRGPYRMPVDEAVRITGQVLSALAAAHALGVIHRDVKPENVFVLDGSELRVKLLDFGVSKFAPAPGAQRPTTGNGAVLGTPQYIAPEQWLDAARADHRADLYSVGVLLYELLTGVFPYPGDGGPEQLQEMVEHTVEAERPSRLRSDVPAAIDGVVLRALEPMPAMRFATAQDFLDALRPFGAAGIDVTHDPPSSRPMSAPPPLSLDAIERSRSVVPPPPTTSRPTWAIAAVVAALCASTALFVARHRPAAQAAAVPAPVRVSPDAPRVRLSVSGVGRDAEVRAGGVLQPSLSFEVPRGASPVAVQVRDGASSRTVTVVPDRDQTLVFAASDALPATAAPVTPTIASTPSPPSTGHRRRHHSHHASPP